MTRYIWIRLGVILLLGLLPFFLFIGETASVVENGRVLVDRRWNYLGVVLAATGLILAVLLIVRRSLSDRLDAAPTPFRARLVAGVLGVLCLMQLALSADLLRMEGLAAQAREIWQEVADDLSDTIAIWRGLQSPPDRAYAGLSAEDRGGYQALAEEEEEPELRRMVAIAQGTVLVLIEQYDAYSTACFRGRYRLSDLAPPPFPPRFGEAEREIIRQVRAYHLQRNPPLLCSDAATLTQMRDAAEEAARWREGLGLLLEGYLREFGPGE